MNINRFLAQTEHRVDNILCLYFDEVIHYDHLSFHHGAIYGDTIPGLIDAIKKLSKKYDDNKAFRFENWAETIRSRYEYFNNWWRWVCSF